MRYHDATLGTGIDCRKRGTATNPCAFSECEHHLGRRGTYSCARQFIAAHPDGATQEQVAEALGLSHTRVQQIESLAMHKIRTDDYVHLPIADDEAA